MDPKTGNIVEKGKFSIMLKTPGSEKHLYLIPIKGNRALAIYPKSEVKQRHVWNRSKKKAEKLF